MAIRRQRNIYTPGADKVVKISRTKIDDYIKCPRCFYIDRKLGINKPKTYPLSLNIAVDKLLKKEFDYYRERGTPHPIMQEYAVDAVPFQHEDLDIWRENFKGLQHYHKPTHFTLTGAIDDVWVDPAGNLIVVDYKATSKEAAVGIDADWQNSYKRQMEFYQWLLRQRGFPVSRRGYFVYANGKTDRLAFDNKLDFDLTLHAYDGDDAWVEGTLRDIHRTLRGKLPAATEHCEYCQYREATREHEII